MTGTFPAKLKIAKVIPLYKKEDDTIVGNYRPVSLLPAISKLFEKITFNQLYEYFQTNKLFHVSQYGFRQQHSTEFAALELADRVFRELDNKNISVAVFMDLSKAFDTLDHSILLQKLQFYGIHDIELNWFESYLSDRYQFVEIDGIKSDLNRLYTGVPQGSILGPLLFLIYMNDICNSTNKFEFILYADDTTLYISFTSRTDTSELINPEIRKVSRWLSINKLSINSGKTKYILFHAKNKDLTRCIPTIIVQGNIVKRVQNFNFLGIVFNENMSWKTHLDKLSNKLSRTAGVLNRIKRTVPLHIMRTLYHSMAQSYLNLGILAWGFENLRINKIQKKLIRIVACAKYNAHTEPLFKALDILTVNDMFNLQSLKFYYKHTKGYLPEYFKSMQFIPLANIHSHDTRNKHHIPANYTRLHMTQNCIRNYISKIVTKSPPNIIDKISTHSLHGFAIYIKKHFIASYTDTCIIENCYVCGRT